MVGIRLTNLSTMPRRAEIFNYSSNNPATSSKTSNCFASNANSRASDETIDVQLNKHKKKEMTLSSSTYDIVYFKCHHLLEVYFTKNSAFLVRVVGYFV